MYQVKDSIKGKQITLVYSAPELTMESKVPLWSKRKAISEHLNEHTATQVLCTTDNQGIQNWRAAYHSGYSFAAAIDDWLIEESLNVTSVVGTSSNFILAIPLDERIYTATIANGLIQTETCFVTATALKNIDDQSENSIPLIVIDTGARSQESLAARAQPSTTTINLKKYKYQPIWQAFALQKIPHPTHLTPIIILAVVMIAYMYREPVQEALPKVIISRETKPMASFNAATQLDRFASFLTRDNIGRLASSAKQMVFEADTLSIRGTDAEQYPKTAIRFADQIKGSFWLDADGWTIKSPLASSPSLPIENFYYQSLLNRVMTATARVGSPRITEIFENSQTIGAFLEVTLSKPSQYHFSLLASTLAKQPVSVTNLQCELHLGHPKHCILLLRLIGLKK